MKREVFLEKYRSKKSANVESKLSIALSTKNRVFSDSNIDAEFSLYDQYNAERDACEKYRMIFFVNTVASNVLFNMQTEVVKNEGSDNVKVLAPGSPSINPASISDTIISTNAIDRLQAIRDTEYSHTSNGGFVYHCGIDIFNNHMLRAKSFTHVNKIGQFAGNGQHKATYNTIADYMRDGEGKPIKMNTNPLYTQTDEIPLHLYTIDNCASFKNAYTNKIKEKDGWIGFYNPGNIDIPNSDNTDVLINKMMAKNKPCEFIDMYPDRSLYSFVPKYNKYRYRVERNWDYYITYPFSSDTSIINSIFGGENQCLKAATIETGYSQSSVEVIFCRTYLKHTFRVGEEIAIYYYDGNEFKKYAQRVQIYSTGDDENSKKDRYFSIRVSDIKPIYSKIFEKGLYYKKVVRNQECEYYARLYKKLQRVNTNGERSGELRSDLNKASFSENIYGDRVAQIVFTDDINVEGLTDNLGRNVSEVFFTTVKTNRGKDEWKAKDYNSESVEFSHCFGEIKAGLYFGDDCVDSLVDDRIDNTYNIRKINNVNNTNLSIYFGDAVYYGSGINYLQSEDVFYGDIIEFDKYNFTETELSPFLHRFNTTQREETLVQTTTTSDVLGDIRWDSIKSDDYEPDERGIIVGFKTEEKHYAPNVNNGYIGHIGMEGSFYNPHTRVEIKEIGDRITSQAKLINFYSNLEAGTPAAIYDSVNGNTTLEIKYPTDYGFGVHDIISVYDAGSESQLSRTIFGEIILLDKDAKTMTISFDGMPFGAYVTYIGRDENGKKRYYMYYSKDSVPEYSILVPSINAFVWRDFVAPSEMGNNDELFDMAFSNGRFYIEKNINLFVRRQDPFGEFGLLYAKNATEKNPMEYFRLSGEQIDLSSVYNFYNNINNICY